MRLRRVDVDELPEQLALLHRQRNRISGNKGRIVEHLFGPRADVLQSVQSAIDGAGEGEGERNVTGHTKSVLLRFVDDRVECRAADEVVDLDEVGGERQAAANGGPCIADILEEFLARRVAVNRLTAGQK